MNELQKNFIYLLTCSVNGLTPDAEKIKSIDLDALYQFSRFHTVRSAVNIALERADIQHESFHQAMKKAIRKNIYLDVERQTILESLEQHGIWYMPLKGSILKDLYPENGMREMADNDVLYDADKQKEVMQIMLAHGYTAKSVGKSHHDVYRKLPVLNFELHTALFSAVHAENLYHYYRDTKRLLQKDSDNRYGYHFSDEDFYIFMTAHEWKHFNGSGTGIRSLLDCYLYMKVKGDSLDWDYILEQVKLLEIADFEQKRRKLAETIFSSVTTPDLSEHEQELLMSYLTAGTYGTLENSIKKKLKTQSRLSFWWHSVLIPRKQMEHSVPFTKISPLLYPVGVIWRCGRVLIFNQNRLKQTIKVVKKYGK